MKLEYLEDLTDNGKYENVISDRLIRIYDFDNLQASLLKDVIEKELLDSQKEISLSALYFVEPLNCSLTLKLSSIDKGIAMEENGNFNCYLTDTGYKEMAYLMEPFCTKEANGYQWLYEIDCPIALLFSPGGTW